MLRMHSKHVGKGSLCIVLGRCTRAQQCIDSARPHATSLRVLTSDLGDCTPAGMAKVTASMDKVQSLAAAVTREVRSGGLADRLTGKGGRQRGRTRRPYSPWLAQPYAKVLASLIPAPST